MSNADIIRKFYEAFSNSNAEGMVGCYSDNIVFEDPAFGELQGDKAKNMWRMLVARSKGQLKISYSDVWADENKGSANWIAEYTFSQTGRKVINKIHAEFAFENGVIVKHHDHFDLWKWSRQALGWKGYLLGWTGFMQGKIRSQSNALLQKFNAAATRN